MSAGHISGPWIAEFTDTPYSEIGESWVVDGPEGSICTIDCPAADREGIARSIAALPDLLRIVAIFLGHDERFQIAVGGNPNAVDTMLDGARHFYEQATGESSLRRVEG